VVSYLNLSTEGPLLRVVERELLAAHETRLLEKEDRGLRWLLRSKCKDDLARLCVAFCPCCGPMPGTPARLSSCARAASRRAAPRVSPSSCAGAVFTVCFAAPRAAVRWY
jgi:hypothetical protein